MRAHATSSSGRAERRSTSCVPRTTGPAIESSASDEEGPSARCASTPLMSGGSLRLQRLVLARRPPRRQPLELRLHERVEVTVEDGACVRRLVAGPQVLDHLVGVEDVAPDLVAPAGRDVLPLEPAQLRLLLLEAALEEARLEDLRRCLLVLRLGPLV